MSSVDGMSETEMARRVEAVRAMVRLRAPDVDHGGGSEIQRDLRAMVQALDWMTADRDLLTGALDTAQREVQGGLRGGCRERGGGVMERGAGLIAAERRRQIVAEGWTAEHDDHHTAGELAIAAASLAVSGTDATIDDPHNVDTEWGHIVERHADNRLRQLAIAGALIAAEIDRLMRAAEART